MSHHDQLVCGCDVGSTTGKALILRDGEIIGYSVIPCAVRPEMTAEKALAAALEKAGLPAGTRMGYVVGTGYGRVRIPFADENVSEITCHGLGVYHLDNEARTVIDIGGQDCKVIRLSPAGKVIDFAMNDKCAAGTGRFFEAMSRVLGLSLEDLASLSQRSNSPAPITSQCSVFAESEVITLLNEGVGLEDIAAGINDAIAARLSSLARKVSPEEKVVITGGCAKNSGLLKALREKLGMEIAVPEMDPQVIGALGAALIAWRRLQERTGGSGG
ncbi:MAG: acyl-CoA dehydratase activase [Candidatus Geothermincolales bacterium]